MKPLARAAGLIGRAYGRATFAAAHPGVPILHPERVGTYHSQAGQDLFLSALLYDYLQSEERWWILDVGCSHPERFSNSLFFEETLGCRTLAVDPQAELAQTWAARRPAAVFVHAAIGRRAGSVSLEVPVGETADPMLASTVSFGSRRMREMVQETEMRIVPARPLSAILDEHGVREVLFASIDVEGAETEVLSSIDFSAVHIHCFLIENNSYSLFGSEDVRRLLAAHRYRFVARIGYLDDVLVHESALPRVRRFSARSSSV